MPSWLYVCSTTLLSLSDFDRTVTNFVPFAGRITVGEPTEAEVETRARDAYTVDNLYVRVTSNGLSGASTVSFRLNGVTQTALEVSIPGGGLGVFQDAGAISIASGDRFNTQVATGAGNHGTTLELTIISYTLAHASDDVPIMINSGPSSTATGVDQGTTRYITPTGGRIGNVDANATETDHDYLFRVAATLRNLRVVINSNNTDNASTFRTRVNAANGNQSVSIPAGGTGEFEDTTNNDVIASGDRVAYEMVAGAGMTGDLISMELAQVKVESAGQIMGFDLENQAGPSAGQTRFAGLQGVGATDISTESDIQVEGRFSFEGTNLFVSVLANSMDAATGISLRKNGADSALAISVPASGVGEFEDTDTESFAATDLADYRVDGSGSTTGSITIPVCGFELRQPPTVEGPEVIHFRSLTAFGRP